MISKPIRQERIAKGVCTECGGIPHMNRKKCMRHLKADAAWQKRKRMSVGV